MTSPTAATSRNRSFRPVRTRSTVPRSRSRWSRVIRTRKVKTERVAVLTDAPSGKPVNTV